MKFRPLIERFSEKYEQITESGCWIWTAFLNKAGYGRFHVDSIIKSRLAHRISYELVHGKTDSHLDHLCRVRCCVNPDHLEPVTPKENAIRGMTGKHHKAKTHCPQGHLYEGKNLYQSAKGYRSCLVCINKRKNERRSIQRLKRKLVQ